MFQGRRAGLLPLRATFPLGRFSGAVPGWGEHLLRMSCEVAGGGVRDWTGLKLSQFEPQLPLDAVKFKG